MNGPMRRGACPTLSTPMQTGDGLLARLNPLAGGLSCKTLIGLCESALRHGNGVVEVTARGSLQIRGLTPSSASDLAGEIDALGIAVRSGVPVETGPLAGIDPTEISDPRPLAGAIRSAIDQAGLAPRLGPKVSVIVDGGGRIGMSDIIADVRLTAVKHDGETLWHCALGGSATTARSLGLASESGACEAAIASLEAIASLGREARATDIEIQPVSARSRIDDRNPELPASRQVADQIGRFPLAGSAHALGIALPFGAMPAEKLMALAHNAEALGASEIRSAPRRTLLILGRSPDACRRLQDAAAARGFITDPADPRLSIAVCPGAPACASGHIATRTLAEHLARESSDIFDGSFTLHVSGCQKGCAHPGTAALTLVGDKNGTGVVINGKAGSWPAACRSAETVTIGLANLVARLRISRQPNETTAACLARLGAAEIATAFGNEQA